MRSKRFLYMVCILVVVNLFTGVPVFASDEPMCPHHEATVPSLRACVAHAAEMGHIDNQGVANSLLAKLDAAQSALGRGQKDVAIAQLQAFAHEVKAQAGKHIDAAHAEHMVMHANEVIAALR